MSLRESAAALSIAKGTIAVEGQVHAFCRRLPSDVEQPRFIVLTLTVIRHQLQPHAVTNVAGRT
jgi:hypothetical protein